MKRATAVPHFLQLIGVILFCVLLLVIVAQQIGGGQVAYKAIEKASLVYTISSSVNALSVMEEGYVRKELLNDYDIKIGKTISRGKNNYYVVVEQIEAAEKDDIFFTHEEGECGTSASPIIISELGDVVFHGRLSVEDPCYELEASLELNGKELDIIIKPVKDAYRDCEKCTGSIYYSGRVKDLSPGTYNVRIWKKYQFLDEPDTVLGEKEVEIEYVMDVSEDDEKYYFITNDVTPTVIKNVECVLISKQFGGSVTLEKCIKGQETETESEFVWYKTQLYPGASGECGPTVVSMAIGYARQEDVHQIVIRDMLGYRYADVPELKGSTSYDELLNALKTYDVDARKTSVTEVGDILEILDGDRIVIISQKMSYITAVSGDWKENRVGRHHDYERGHYIILKGFDPEDEPDYFVVYDPLSNPYLKYDNGDLVGKDRLYPVEEVWEALENGAQPGYIIEVRRE